MTQGYLEAVSVRINYNQPLDIRIGYLFDHYLRLPILIRHLMVNYFDNKSVADWMLDNPYKNPFELNKAIEELLDNHNDSDFDSDMLKPEMKRY